jgi:assimilatory nitrate reductase catalytic subunit
LLGKFARVALGTSQIDYNGRFCMSSAAAAALKAFGMDRGLPFPLEDIQEAEVILLVGSNVAETMPPMMQYFESQRLNGGHLIVVDPRTSATAQAAALHPCLTPGSDAALANGLLHILIRDGLIDRNYICERTEGFEQMRAMVGPTVFVPFHWGGLQSANRLTHPALDATSRMPEFKVCAVRIERAAQLTEEDIL